MPLAVVLQLRAIGCGSISGGTGRAVHGFWFGHWAQVRSEIADWLHAQAETPPFSLSPLMGLPQPRRGSATIAAGKAAWLRLAVFSDRLEQALCESWLPGLPKQIELAEVGWEISGVAMSAGQHPWAGQSAYEQLAGPRLFSLRPPRRWRLEFATPTAFHAAAGHLPFPLPDSLLASWLRRWAAYAPLSLPEDLPLAARQGLLVSAYQLETAPVRYGERLTVGCLGRYTLHGGGLPPAQRAAIDALVDFAFFAGSGHHTTQGMGLTRLLERS